LLYRQREDVRAANEALYEEKVLGAIGAMELGRPARREVERASPVAAGRSGSGRDARSGGGLLGGPSVAAVEADSPAGAPGRGVLPQAASRASANEASAWRQRGAIQPGQPSEARGCIRRPSRRQTRPSLAIASTISLLNCSNIEPTLPPLGVVVVEADHTSV